jgi:hypothetical protein
MVCLVCLCLCVCLTVCLVCLHGVSGVSVCACLTVCLVCLHGVSVSDGVCGLPAWCVCVCVSDGVSGMFWCDCRSQAQTLLVLSPSLAALIGAANELL